MNNAQLNEELCFCENSCNNVLRTHAYDKTKAIKRYFMLIQECADICRVCIVVLKENSKDQEEFLKLCTEITKECAEECQKENIASLHECIIACKKCSEACARHLYAV